MDATIACEALRKGVCLEFSYEGYGRLVEVHIVGVSTSGNMIMRAWQVSGGSSQSDAIGWKTFRLDAATGGTLTKQTSWAPRDGYRKIDREIVRVICQV